MRKSIHLSKRI